MNTLSNHLKKKFLLVLALTHNHSVFVNTTYYQIVNKITTRVVTMEQELLIFSEYLTHFCFIVVGCCLTIIFLCSILSNVVVWFFVCFLLVIVLSVLRRITVSDYPIWYLQIYLSLSLLLDYLYTKASMCLLARYYCCSC